jgi:hypothetical protein
MQCSQNLDETDVVGGISVTVESSMASILFLFFVSQSAGAQSKH